MLFQNLLWQPCVSLKYTFVQEPWYVCHFKPSQQNKKTLKGLQLTFMGLAPWFCKTIVLIPDIEVNVLCLKRTESIDSYSKKHKTQTKHKQNTTFKIQIQMTYSINTHSGSTTKFDKKPAVDSGTCWSPTHVKWVCWRSTQTHTLRTGCTTTTTGDWLHCWSGCYRLDLKEEA